MVSPIRTPTSRQQGYTTPWPLAAGTDGDGVHTEQNEETWLDNNSTPLMINRFDGSLGRRKVSGGCSRAVGQANESESLPRNRGA